jgi:hypothetical protein
VIKSWVFLLQKLVMAPLPRCGQHVCKIDLLDVTKVMGTQFLDEGVAVRSYFKEECDYSQRLFVAARFFI